MIKKIAFLLLICSPFISFSQQKKTTKKLDAQVKKAQEQAAAAAKQDKANNETILPYASIGSPLLPFTLVTSHEVRITNNDVPNDKPVILVLFNPMCDHCQKAASVIKENMGKFNNPTVIFACGMNLLGELDEFIKTVGLDESPNVHICAGPEEFTNQVFLKKGIPQIMVYNKEHFLKKIMFENVDTEATINALNAN